MKSFKIAIISVFTIGIISFLPIQNVSANGTHTKSTDAVINEILDKQGLDNIENIDCSKIQNNDFEELGEAVMSLRHPDEDEHEIMDNMMGGEGSESLKAMHIAMGRNYLKCWDKNESYSMPGMMGFDNNRYYNSMMSSPYKPTGLLWIGGLILCLTTILGTILALILFFITSKSNNNSLGILNKRYASGKINKNTYHKTKKDLNDNN